LTAARVLALVDGEHYPPTTRWALATARAEGYDPVACLLVGGVEKLGADRALDLGVPVEPAGSDLARSLREALDRFRPDAVLDLSDEPVMGDPERALVAAVTLAEGLRYVGPDFALEPPIRGAALSVPTLAVIGTGKRTGKTAVAGEAARVADRAGMDPVVVAMGRGGPPAPQVVEAGSLSLERLLELSRSGRHAASDYLEDALTTGVTTIGARRAGGGLFGGPYVSNVVEAARIAEEREPGLVILEGSGASVPPVPWDAGVLVAPSGGSRGALGPSLGGAFRVLLSDLVVFTIGDGPHAGPPDLSDRISHVRRLRPGARIVVVELTPVPLEEVRGKKVLFATTAPQSAGPRLVSALEAQGVDVVGITHHLGDRAGLSEDLEAAPAYDVLVTELKAAAVDVAAESALARDAGVVFCDNRAATIEGDGDLPDLLAEAAGLAVDRAGAR
jgi:cyclic 2,3-diphosphoglycerate synthetase